MKPRMSIDELARWHSEIESLTARAEIVFDKILDIITDSYCQGKKINKNCLSDQLTEKLELTASIILSHWNIELEVTKERIDAILKTEGGEKFDRCVSEVLKGLVDKAKKPISPKRMKVLRSRSFAICTSQLGPKEAQK